MKLFFILACMLVACAWSVQTAKSGEPKTKISVFYETLCGDSKRFIANQLKPLTRSPLGKYVDIELVPYGKATTTETSDGDYEFSCQHGAPECQGNKEHACALKHLDKSDAIKFITCAMSTPYPPEAGKECAQRYELDYSKIKACSSSSEGNELLAKNGRKTHGLKPKLYFVPWVMYDGKWSEDKMDRSLANLRDVVCETIGDENCAETENRGSRRVRRRRWSSIQKHY